MGGAGCRKHTPSRSCWKGACPCSLGGMIELVDVVKRYAGPWFLPPRQVRALDGITLRIDAGEAVGVVGLNGAGKSTLVRLLLGYLRPTEGRALIDGVPPRSYVERHGIAYVPEKVAIPGGWTVREAMRAYAMLGQGAEEWDGIDPALQRLGLSRLADRRVRTLSKGNVQRLGIAQSLLGDRRIMILDEPTDGLDPVWIAELREIIGEWRSAGRGRILVLASHNLAEVERLTDRRILLHNGRVEPGIEGGGRGKGLEKAFLERIATLEEARS
jgi:ABC-type multidrug transport system ATPase subunit